MPNVIYFPDTQENEKRLLQKALASAIHTHPDAVIADRWNEMAQVTIKRFPGPPDPSLPQLDLSDFHDLDPTLKALLLDNVEHYIASYMQDVRDQVLRMHGDLWRLQKRIAELESEEISKLKL